MLSVAGTLLLAGMLVGDARADTTIIVPAGTRLDVQTQGGSIAIDTWNRNEVRVEATYGSRGQVRVTTAGQVVRVRSGQPGIGVGIVDYRITVPAAMDLELSGIYVELSTRGSQGQIRAQTVQGDIFVQGGVGQVSAESVQGNVVVEGARATVNARAVSGQVRLRDVQGDIQAQSASGAVVLEDVRSNNVSASSVSGQVHYDGVIAPGGRYSFASHSGAVTVAAPDDLDATISLATLSGTVTTTIPGLTLSETRAGRRRTLTARNGSAIVELESFSGNVRLVRRGEVSPPAPRAPR